MIKFLMMPAVLMAGSPIFAQAGGSAAGGVQQQPVTTSVGAVIAPDAEDTRVRCRSVNLTNSRIPERICRTRAQWDEIERQSREAMERNRRGAGASGN